MTDVRATIATLLTISQQAGRAMLKNQGNSIKQSLAITVFLVTGLALLLSFAFSIFNQSQHYQQALIKRTQATISVLGPSVLEAVQNSDTIHANRVLTNLQHSTFITHVHLYRAIPSTTQVNFFTSYNRPNMAPLPIRTNQLLELTQPRLNKNHIELAGPLYNTDSSLAGYIYVRTSLQELNNYIWRSVLTGLVTIFVATLLAVLLSKFMHNRLLRPLTNINNQLRDIHIQKNYTLRLPPAKHNETSQFSIGVNGILDKLQRVNLHSEASEIQHKTLTDELEIKIGQRTQALRAANNELIEALEQLHAHQQRRIETERLASMTDMVAGIAHEINTPIGLSVTAASILDERLTLLTADFETRSAESNAAILKELKNNINIVQRNLARSSQLIGNFRSLAFEHAKESPEAINLKLLTEKIADHIRPLLQQAAIVRLQIDAPDQIVTLRRRPLETIISELLENALLHGFKGQEKGTIELKVDNNDEQLFISCQDNGVGMSDEMQHRVFEPFMTSNRVNGHPGLGMHLVYNLVTHILKGAIVCESTLGKGTLITVEIPLTE